jgi:single-strand DNA-binding protein
MNYKGRLIHISEIVTIKEFTKREFVIETQEMYPQKILFELQGERVDIIDVYKIGDLIDVSYHIKAKPYTSQNNVIKYFNTVIAWKIQKIN